MKKLNFYFLSKGAFLGLLVAFSCTMNAQVTKRHSYKFSDGAKDTPGTGVTAVDGVINGGTVANGVYTTATNGDDYISFDGSALALNTYNGLTLEAFFKASDGLNAGRNAFLAFFGDSWDNLLFMSNTRDVWGCGTTCYSQAGDVKVEITSPIKDDNQLHHLVFVLNNNSVKFYLDGSLLAQKDAAPSLSTLGTGNAYLCKSPQSSDTWLGTIDEFNIYDGELSAEEIATNAQNYLASTGISSVNQLDLSYSVNNNKIIIKNTSNEASDAKVTVFNILGRIQYSATMTSGSNVVNLPTAGVYIVELSKSGSKQTFKVVVK